MKKISVIIALSVVMAIGGLLTACGGHAYSGEWYYPEELDTPLILSDDGTFVYGEIGGTWSLEDDNILLVSNSGLYGGKVLSVIDNATLVDEEGDYYYNSYETAEQIYEDEESEREKIQAEHESKIARKTNKIEKKFYGTFRGDGFSEEYCITLNKDNTFYGTVVDPYESDREAETFEGTWAVECVSDRDSGLLFFYDKNGEKIDSCVINENDGGFMYDHAHMMRVK